MPIAAACFGILLPAAGAAADIVVKVEPPRRVTVFFDRDEPPSEMPVDAAEGAAACSNVFEIEATIESSVEVVSYVAVRVYPEKFDIVTRLRTTIFLPDQSPDTLEAHEEGHRAIGEHFYGDAEFAARDAAMSLVGRSFDAIGDDRAAAEQAAGRMVLAALRDAFMQRTQARSAAANALYDEITEHGASHRTPSTVAVDVALAYERRQHETSAH